jgi:hypothetical protein
MIITPKELEKIETIIRNKTEELITMYLANINKNKEAYVNVLPDDWNWLQDFVEWIEVRDWD